MTEEGTLFDVTVRGPGKPEVVVIGGIHGDETGGVRAVRRLRGADLDLQRTVGFVLANPAAIDAGKRYIATDLNRAFPGNPNGNREQQLAAKLCEFVRGKTTLSLHGTKSEPTPFALVHRSGQAELQLAAKLPVPAVVDYAGIEYGTITACGLTVEVEVGAQGTDAAAKAAERQARAFLQCVDALPGDPRTMDSVFYRMYEPVPKPPGREYAVHVRNFTRVSNGTVYATVDERELVAEEPFVPILFSVDGYREIFGYRGEHVTDSLTELIPSDDAGDVP